MVGWHHGLDGHEFVQALGAGDGQRSLVDYSPWDRKESDMTERHHFHFHILTKRCQSEDLKKRSQILGHSFPFERPG